MEVGSPSMDKPVTVHHYADNDGAWVYFVDAEAEIERHDKRIEELQAEVERLREAILKNCDISCKPWVDLFDAAGTG
jgi:hypothetical protein